MIDALSAVRGIAVGHATDETAATGVTVVLPDRPMRAAVDCRGGGPATREIAAISNDATLGIAHAVVLSGGSVLGLAAADAVAARLSASGVGVRLTEDVPAAPIVVAAALYDFSNGGDKEWGEAPPYASLGLRALETAHADERCGAFGAGFGATAGRWRGGIGTASAETEGGIIVAALLAVNAIGSPVMPDGSCLWAWPFERDGEFGGFRPEPGTMAHGTPPDLKRARAGEATTIGVIACSAPLERTRLKRLAVMAQDGIARAVRPSHAPFDGDTLIALCPDEPAPEGMPDDLALGTMAADCISRAIGRGVWGVHEPLGRHLPVREAFAAR